MFLISNSVQDIRTDRNTYTPSQDKIDFLERPPFAEREKTNSESEADYDIGSRFDYTPSALVFISD